MRYAVTVVAPPKYVHAAAFLEIAETLDAGLRSLGHDSTLTAEGNISWRQHIVLGANLLPLYRIDVARDAILYNLEQIEVGSDWLTTEYLDLLRAHRVWDYSERNAERLEKLGIRVEAVLPIGYAECLTRIEHREKDIDVLFYGSFNPRRKHLIGDIRALGIGVEAHFGLYGKPRDQLIARSRIVLNAHFYESKVLEMARISYLLANRCVVLSETSADPEEDARLLGAVAFASYDDLPARACELLVNEAERQTLAARGFELMRSRRIEPLLARVL